MYLAVGYLVTISATEDTSWRESLLAPRETWSWYYKSDIALAAEHMLALAANIAPDFALAVNIAPAILSWMLSMESVIEF